MDKILQLLGKLNLDPRVTVFIRQEVDGSVKLMAQTTENTAPVELVALSPEDLRTT